MKRRFPLWLTLIPLAVAIGGYWWLWSGYRDALRTELARVLPGETVVIGGFPYRLEAFVETPQRASRARDIAAQVSAARAVLNRGPWQPDLTIVRAVEPRVTARIPALAASALSIAAPSSETSVHLDKAGNLARLSTVFTRARAELALLAAPLTAETIEIHVRETPGRTSEPWSPTLPERAQLVLAGQRVRIGNGAPLALAADMRVTGPTRLIDYARWAGQGSVLVRGLTLGDQTGEVLRLDATLAVVEGRPHATGSIVTVCPASVSAAFAAAPRVSEQRLRLPVKLTLDGTPGGWRLGGVPDAPRAVRSKQPPCPTLR